MVTLFDASLLTLQSRLCGSFFCIFIRQFRVFSCQIFRKYQRLENLNVVLTKFFSALYDRCPPL